MLSFLVVRKFRLTNWLSRCSRARKMSALCGFSLRLVRRERLLDIAGCGPGAGQVQDISQVVVDSPPVMAVTDAALVAHSASGVLFVVGAEMTSRHAAQRALDQLEQAQAKFIGAVLNRVDLERNAYYYSTTDASTATTSRRTSVCRAGLPPRVASAAGKVSSSFTGEFMEIELHPALLVQNVLLDALNIRRASKSCLYQEGVRVRLKHVDNGAGGREMSGDFADARSVVDCDRRRQSGWPGVPSDDLVGHGPSQGSREPTKHAAPSLPREFSSSRGGA